jgi:hypothetical protein
MFKLELDELLAQNELPPHPGDAPHTLWIATVGTGKSRGRIEAAHLTLRPRERIG